MEPGYFGDAGGPIGNGDRRIGGGLMGAVHQQQAPRGDELAQMLQAASKDLSPVERELQQLNAATKRLADEIDSLSRQLTPLIAPKQEKAAGAASSTGQSLAPLHQAIHRAGAQIARLAQQVAELRGSLSI